MSVIALWFEGCCIGEINGLIKSPPFCNLPDNEIGYDWPDTALAKLIS
jgi:hypothetical protein